MSAADTTAALGLLDILHGDFAAPNVEAFVEFTDREKLFERLADGRCRVVYRATVDGPNAEQLGPDIGPQVTADFPEVLAALKARAEASPRT